MKTYAQELKEVFDLIKEQFPTAYEYDVNDDVVTIIDELERPLGTITTDELTKIWNLVEGGH